MKTMKSLFNVTYFYLSYIGCNEAPDASTYFRYKLMCFVYISFIFSNYKTG